MNKYRTKCTRNNSHTGQYRYKWKYLFGLKVSEQQLESELNVLLSEAGHDYLAARDIKGWGRGISITVYPRNIHHSGVDYGKGEI